MDINALQSKISAPRMEKHEMWKVVYVDEQEVIDLLDEEMAQQPWSMAQGLQLAKALIQTRATEYRWTQETVKK